MSGPSGEDASLDGAVRELLEAWRATSDSWRDAARSEIDRLHIDPIGDRARHAARALGELAALCDDAIRRCE